MTDHRHVLSTITVWAIIGVACIALAGCVQEAPQTLIVRAVAETDLPIIGADAAELEEPAPRFAALLERAHESGTARTEDQRTIRDAEHFVNSRDRRGITAIAIRIGAQYYEFEMSSG